MQGRVTVRMRCISWVRNVKGSGSMPDAWARQIVELLNSPSFNVVLGKWLILDSLPQAGDKALGGVTTREVVPSFSTDFCDTHVRTCGNSWVWGSVRDGRWRISPRITHFCQASTQSNSDC
eukprot:4741191-Amphidinium_carterae.1